MTKGWHKEPMKHSLASQGIKTTKKERYEGYEEEEFIKNVLETYDWIKPNSIEIKESPHNNDIDIHFRLKGIDPNFEIVKSSVHYQSKNRIFYGMIRLPPLDGRKYNNIKSKLDNLSDNYKEIENYYIDKEGIIVPHIDFRMKFVKCDNILDRFEEISTWIEDVLESDIYD